MSVDTKEMRRAGNALFLELPAPVAKSVQSILVNAADEIDELREKVLDLYEDILLEHSYSATGDSTGWLYHSCMSDQEYALARLLEAGWYEEHPDRSALYRRVRD